MRKIESLLVARLILMASSLGIIVWLGFPLAAYVAQQSWGLPVLLGTVGLVLWKTWPITRSGLVVLRDDLERFRKWLCRRSRPPIVEAWETALGNYIAAYIVNIMDEGDIGRLPSEVLEAAVQLTPQVAKYTLAALIVGFSDDDVNAIAEYYGMDEVAIWLMQEREKIDSQGRDGNGFLHLTPCFDKEIRRVYESDYLIKLAQP